MSYLTDKRFVILSSVILIIITFLTFRDIPNQQFLDWDDNTYINSNPNIRSLTLNNIYWMFTNYSNSNWHPVTWLTYAFNYHFWGENAFVFKATNVIIHLLTCFVLFITTRKLISSISTKKIGLPDSRKEDLAVATGVVATLLFAIHPQHIESVIWISGRKDLVCTFFYIFGIYAYLKQNTGDNPKIWQYATPLFFILSLMSKTLAVTFPLILIIIDIYVFDKLNSKLSFASSIKNLIKNKTFYLLVAFFTGLITIITQATQIRSIEKMSLFQRLLNSSENLIHHLVTIVYPDSLSPYHPFSQPGLDHNISGYIALAFILLITTGSIMAWRKGYRHLLVIWLAYIVMLLPTSGALRVGHAAVADRYAYLPTSVIFILLSFYFCYFIIAISKNRISKYLTTTLVASLVISFSISTSSYATHWRNDQILWTFAIKKYPDNATLPFINLGYQYNKQNRDDDAVISFLNALYFDPYNRYALEYLGITFMQQQKEEIGINYFEKLTEIRPDLAVGFIRMGDYHYAQNNIDKAIDFYNGAIAASPTEPDTILRSALIDFVTNNLPAAVKKLDYLIQINPKNYNALKLLAQSELRQQNYESAKITANRILQLSPNDAIANDILAKISSMNR